MQTLWDLIVHDFKDMKVGCEKPMLMVAAFGVAYWWIRRTFKKYGAPTPE